MNRSNSSQPIKSTVSRKRIILAAIIFLAALLLMALPFYQPGDVSYVFLLVGRFHPLVLHFPIVLIILALILELLRRFNMLKKADVVITIILVAAAITSIIAITSGYLLYASGDYSGRLPEQHFWIGVITGASILLTTAFFFSVSFLFHVLLILSRRTIHQQCGSCICKPPRWLAYPR